MLRAVIGVAAVAFVAVALAITTLSPAAWPMLLTALVVAAGCLFERRYHDRIGGLPIGADFRPTGERFLDPGTGRAMTVWSDAAGERRYVADDEPPPPVG